MKRCNLTVIMSAYFKLTKFFWPPRIRQQISLLNVFIRPNAEISFCFGEFATQCLALLKTY